MNTVNGHAYGFSESFEEFGFYLIQRMRKAIANHAHRYRDMQEIRKLRDLDDAQLRDLGLVHADLCEVSRLPTNKHATAELQRIARRADGF